MKPGRRLRSLLGMSTPRRIAGRATAARLIPVLGLTATLGIHCDGGLQPAANPVATGSRSHAVTIPVTDCLPASLITAINTANTAGGANVIQLKSGCTYTLVAPDNYWYGPTGLPPITSDLTIEPEQGGTGITIERSSAGGTPKFRLFYVNGAPTTTGGALAGAGHLTLRNVTLRGGLARGGNGASGGGGGLGAGGAIFAQGQVDLVGVTLSGNTAEGGAGSTLGTAPGGGGGMGGNGGSPGGGFHGGGGGMRGDGGDGTAAGGGKGGDGPFGGEGGGGGTAAAGGAGGMAPGNENGADDVPAVSNAPGGGTRSLGGSAPSDGGFASGGGGGAGFGGKGGKGGDPGGAAAGGGGGGGFGGGGGAGNGMGPMHNSSGGAGGGVGGGGGGSGGDAGFGGGGSGGSGFGGFGGGGGTQGTTAFAGGAGNATDGGGGAGLGGAVFLMYGSLAIVNSTLTGNTAQGGASGAAGGSGSGGAIFNLNGTVTVTNSTLALNTSTAGSGNPAGAAQGSGLTSVSFTAADTAAVVLRNSILASNTGGTDLFVFRRAGTSTADAGGKNLVMTQSAGGGATITGTPLTGNPMLAALADQGGPTGTLRLNPGSPAISAGDAAVCGMAPVSGLDQRGQPRCGCDLGAFQTQSIACIDLSVTVTAIAMERGTPGVIEVTVRNSGPADVQDAPVATQLMLSGGPQPSSVSWTCTATGSASCGTESGSADINTTVSLPSGGTAKFVVSIAPSTGDSSVDYQAMVSAPSGFLDPAQGNNAATTTLAVLAPTMQPKETGNIAPDAQLQGCGCRTTGGGGNWDLSWMVLILFGLLSWASKSPQRQRAKQG